MAVPHFEIVNKTYWFNPKYQKKNDISFILFWYKAFRLFRMILSTSIKPNKKTHTHKTHLNPFLFWWCIFFRYCMCVWWCSNIYFKINIQMLQVQWLKSDSILKNVCTKFTRIIVKWRMRKQNLRLVSDIIID